MKKYEVSIDLPVGVRCMLSELAKNPFDYRCSKDLIDAARGMGIGDEDIKSAILFGLEQNIEFCNDVSAKHKEYFEQCARFAELYIRCVKELTTNGLAAYEAALNI